MCDPSDMDAVKTYRYLRLSLIGMAVLIAAAVLHEWRATGWSCVQPSLSDYYYTPAKGALVGALVAIGVALVVVKGNTDWEDVLLNLAGAAAPVIAFVPTEQSGACHSVRQQARGTTAAVANNVFALLVVGLLALVAAAVLARRSRPTGQGVRTCDLVGLAVAGALYAGCVVVFVWARAAFLAHAHYAAAAVLFCCMLAVVSINAWSVAQGRAADDGPTRRDYANAYAAVAVVMLGSVVLMLAWRAVFGWDHAILWIEIMLVASFAAFWTIQTRELWHVGLRMRAAETG